MLLPEFRLSSHNNESIRSDKSTVDCNSFTTCYFLEKFYIATQFHPHLKQLFSLPHNKKLNEPKKNCIKKYFEIQSDIFFISMNFFMYF